MQSNGSSNIVADFILDFLSRLNDKEINYCVLRNYDGLPQHTGNDIDIWVDSGSKEQFHNLIFEVIDKFGLEVIPYKPDGAKRHYYVVHKKNPLEIVHIDCWYIFCWKNIKFIDEYFFKKHLQLFNGIFYVPSPGIEAGVSLLQNLLYHRKVKDNYKNRINELFKKEKNSFLEAAAGPFGKKTSKFIFDKAENTDWLELEENVASFRALLFWRAVFTRPISQLKLWAAYFYKHINNFVFQKEGMFLVLTGPDGSGKTTIANLLITSPVKKFFKKQSYFHGHFHFLPELKRIAGFFKKPKKIPENETGDIDINLKSFGTFRAALYTLYYGLDYILGNIFIWKEKANGGFIVFDRYFYDYLIQNQFANCPKLLSWIISKIIPKPDLIISLKGRADIIFERKPELSKEEIIRQMEKFEKLAKRLKNNFPVETNKSKDETLYDIQRIILSKIKEKQSVK